MTWIDILTDGVAFGLIIEVWFQRREIKSLQYRVWLLEDIAMLEDLSKEEES